MQARKLLIGASIPVGLVAIEQFIQLKLGEIVLLTLPDDRDEAIRLMQYCREKKIYVMISELQRRGDNRRWRCPSLSKADVDAASAAGGEYYLGRYCIGEAGGVLYWPRSYTIDRKVNNYENLPPVTGSREAAEKYVEYLREFIEYERREVGSGRLLNVDSSMMFKYQMQAGIDDLCLEMLPGDPHRMLPAIRGCAKSDSRFWGVHIAFGCYGGFEFDQLWLKRWRQSLYFSFLAGAEFIFPESGYYSFHYDNKSFDFHHPVMAEARRILREFYRFGKIHYRPSDGPEVRLGIISGQYDGCPGLWNPYFWGQYQQGEEWKDSAAERSWQLTEVLTTRENPYSELYLGEHSFSGNPPCGQYDIVPAEAALEVLQQYPYLVFLGWNLMDEALHDKLLAYVRAGGELLLWLPHCNVNDQRGGPIKLFRDGDLRELFGVRIVGQRGPEVTGVKTLPGGTLPLPVRNVRRDPVLMGNVSPAVVEICSDAVQVCASFSDEHGDTVEQLQASPALIEHRLGQGKARLVTAFDYPGSDGMRPLAEHLLRVTALAGQGELRLLCSDAVRYSFCRQHDGLQIIYALNSEFDLSQNLRIWLGGEVSPEFSLPPSELGIFYLLDRVLLHPLDKNCQVRREGSALIVYSLNTQGMAMVNLGQTDAVLTLNGESCHLSPGEFRQVTVLAQCEPGKEEFSAEDYLQEPYLTVIDTKLPY